MFLVPIITIMILLCLCGAFFVSVSNNKNIDSSDNSRMIAQWTTSAVFLMNIFLFANYDFSDTEILFQEEIILDLGLRFSYRVGFDRLSAFFSLLTSCVCLLLVLWSSPSKNKKNLLVGLLLLEAFSVGAFCSFDMFLIYFFIECSIIPMMLMMSDSQDNRALSRFLYYTTISAVLVLTAFIIIYNAIGTSDLIIIISNLQKIPKIAFLILLIGISLKLPVFPFFHWLPIVHVKNNVVTSIALGSLVLKFSTLLICRFFNSSIIHDYKMVILCFSSVSCLFACSHIFVQRDLKKLFAYFSIIHMNMYLFGYISGMGKLMFIFSNICHSLIIMLVFFMVDYIEKYFGSRLIERIKESEKNSDFIKNIFILTSLFVVGVPFSGGFITEISVFLHGVDAFFFGSVIIGIVLLISATFLFYIGHDTFFSSQTEKNPQIFLRKQKIPSFYKIILVVISLVIIIIGVCPNIILK